MNHVYDNEHSGKPVFFLPFNVLKLLLRVQYSLLKLAKCGFLFSERLLFLL